MGGPAFTLRDRVQLINMTISIAVFRSIVAVILLQAVRLLNTIFKNKSSFMQENFVEKLIYKTNEHLPDMKQ